MKKLVAFTCFLILILASGSDAFLNMRCRGTTAASGYPSCNTSNDIELYYPNETGADGNKQEATHCVKFTESTNFRVTEYEQRSICDDNDTGNFEMFLSEHDSTPDEPKYDGTSTYEVTGTRSDSQANSTISDCNVFDIEVVELTTSQTVDAGTYWVCVEEVDGMAFKVGHDYISTGDRYCRSDDNSTWTCSDDNSVANKVLGCRN